MIIKRVKLRPFASFRDREYTFEHGLNVVLGPNEAGKTTLVNAIHAALFIPPGVKKNSQDWRNHICAYIPYPSGDTIRVTLELAAGQDGPIYQLHCAWGGVQDRRLLLDNGQEIAEPEGVRERLQDLLVHGRGTFEAVLLARQDEMVGTLEALRSEEETLANLADMLRRVVMETGGVSVDRMENLLSVQQKELENNWDAERNAPRGNRGLDNPHKRNVGGILAEYYCMARLERALKDACRAEAALLEVSNRLQEQESEYKKVAEAEENMKRIEGDMRKRANLEARRETFVQREKGLTGALDDWGQAEINLKKQEQAIIEGQATGKELAKELKEAEKEAEMQEKRKLLTRVQHITDEIQNKKSQLAQLPAITAGQLEELRAREKELAAMEAEIQGMKIRGFLNSHGPLDLRVVCGNDAEATQHVKGTYAFEAPGRFLLEAPDWTLEVRAGERNLEELEELASESARALHEELWHLGVEDVAEARELRNTVQGHEEDIRFLEKGLQEALGDHSWTALVKEMESESEEGTARDQEIIREDMTRLGVKLGTLANACQELREQISGWTEEHGSRERLLEELASSQRERKELEQEVEALAPLPEGYTNSEAFLEALERLSKRKEGLQADIFSGKESKLEAERSMPDESPEAIEEACQEARGRWQQLLDEAAALRVVTEEFYRLKDELDRDTFSPVQDLFEEYLATLTGDRYRTALMEGALPRGIAADESGADLPISLLSTGTISGVALALRLTLAHHLLADTPGFLVMDDPMVDLDPERKKQAAALLHRAGAEKQIIVTTCDPETARLIGGHLVEM